jgi:guanine deaminase
VQALRKEGVPGTEGKKTMDKQDFMRRAIELSAEPKPASGDRPFGAVVVKNGKIVGEGRNCIGSAKDPTAHSEVMAIRDACTRLGTTDLAGCELYTSCEPCPMCAGAIFWARLDKVYYAVSAADSAGLLGNSGIVEEIGKPIDRRSTPAERLLGEEALTVMRRWGSS